MAKPGFWNDPDQARRTVEELKREKGRVGRVLELAAELDDLELLHELAEAEDDAGTEAEVLRDAQALVEQLDDLEFHLAMNDPHDPGGCYVSIHAGAGGTDAADWAQMLGRMYEKYCESKGWKVEEIDVVPAEEAGVRKLIIRVDGEYAHGYLRQEAGVHRLVRLSPFDANQRRQTSFASVDVAPDVEEVELEIDENDLKIDTYRAGGAGGQHVNKTDSAVRITHIPTGIVVQCQNERSQHKNKRAAMTLLKVRMYKHQEQARRKEQQAAYDQKGDNEFGYQIRSYVIHPYQMVKDLRSGHQTGNIEAVLEGDIDAFITAQMRSREPESGRK